MRNILHIRNSNNHKFQSLKHVDYFEIFMLEVPNQKDDCP